MRKGSAPTLWTGLPNSASNFRETLKQYLENEQALAFMNSFIGTPACWEKFKPEILTMVKQLGVPTFFLILSSADLR